MFGYVVDLFFVYFIVVGVFVIGKGFVVGIDLLYIGLLFDVFDLVLFEVFGLFIG